MAIVRKLALAAAVAAALMLSACTGTTTPVSTGSADTVLVVGEGGQFVRNFNPFTPGAADPTRAMIYEPLYIVSLAGGNREYPWLATSYKWSDDLLSLTFTIRDGVKWSDGEALTAKDVYWTMSAGRDNPVFNQANLWGDNGIATDVVQDSDNTVTLKLKEPDSSLFPTLVNNLYIVPEHIWSKVDDVKTFTNPDPVGSGPFTQVESLSTQSIDMGRNPNYWQKDKPAFNTLRLVDNTNAALDLQAGNQDWNGAFVPNVQKVYDDANPNFHHYYAPASPPVVVFLNLTDPLFAEAAVRKALSKSIDRDEINTGAEYGDATPADATGLNGLYKAWVDSSVSNENATFDLDGAKQLLQGEGFTMSGSTLHDPKGKPVKIELSTNSDYPDYVAAAQIIVRQWKALGIDVTIAPAISADWQSQLSNGNYQASISFTFSGGSPVSFYDQLLGSQNATAIGTPAGANNYGRYRNAQLDDLISQARLTADHDKQQGLVNQMQQIVADDMPVIPVLIPPVFYQYNTTKFTGWPTKDDYYASGPPWSFPERLVVITTITPK